MARILSIFVPRPGTTVEKHVAPGSAIVVDLEAESSVPGKVKAYLEGNLYGAENIKTFEDKVINAAGRLVQRYPTVAVGYYQLEDLLPIGILNWDSRHFDLDRTAIKEWEQRT